MNLLIDTALKGSVLIAAAAAVSYFLRGRSAAARHAAWTAAVIAHLALPAVSLLMPDWNLAILPTPSWMETRVAAPVATPAAHRDEIVSDPAVATPPPEKSPAPVSQPTPSSPAATNGATGPSIGSALIARARAANVPTPVLLWILGGTLVLLRLAIGTWKVGRLAKQGDRVDDGEWLSLTTRLAGRLGITRPLTLLRGDKLAVPVTWGVVYPAVLLPPDSVEWPEARRRFVLVHEMAHVKRFDALTQLLAQFAIAIFWFDPLIWIAAHRMRVEREHACDDYVLRDGTKPSLYAGELLEMVQSIGTPQRESAAPAFAALAMARRSEFEGRMLAILDSRQDRHTLGRASTMLATAALVLLVLPLAALRPFATATEASVQPPPSAAIAAVSKEDPEPLRIMSSHACDSVMKTNRASDWVHTHDGAGDDQVVEYLSSTSDRCAQAAIVGETIFSNDRLVSLRGNSYVTIREITPSFDRTLKITPRGNGTMEFAARLNGAEVPFDDTMRSWLSRLLPEVLTEAAVDAPQRVARELARGGVPAVLNRIANIKSPASRRTHYEALLDERPLTAAEYDRVSEHVAKYLAASPTDLSAVLTRLASGPATGTKSLGAAIQTLGRAQEAMSTALGVALDKNMTSRDTASTLTQYGVSDDPEMLLLALKGAADISTDSDKRVLLQTLAPGALRRSDVNLRKAFFRAAQTISVDSDLRLTLQSALPFGHGDPLVTSNVLMLVADKISTDSDKRLVLITALDQKLINSAKLRSEFMTAAKTIHTSSEYRIVIQAMFDK